ncbi:MAG TPA: carboxylesterase/lipase family protein [Steroidobacteraceae bacterium]|nr:carboxylesterase/lipase family protein [Steroidobacteraceae bacterium]
MTIADTALGRLQGQTVLGCRVWKGIPFAAAPVGALRFRAPRPPSPWSGVRAAVEFGPACPQALGTRGRPRTLPPKYSEDCLYLNVWAPARSDGPWPVALWLYGGAFVAGSSNPYDPTHLVSTGELIVVTANYRTGPFGCVNFAALPGGEAHECNVGLRDQIAALEWIRDHIAAFGGDPQRVTIMGESAGSVSVALLLQCGAALGLFHRAIMASGTPTLIHDREMSERLAREYAQLLGIGAQPWPALQALPSEALLRAQQRIAARYPHTIPAAPWFDGALLPASPQASLDTVSAAVPLLAGRTRDETRTFEILPGPPSLPMTRAQVGALIRDQLGEAAEQHILQAYPTGRRGDRQISTDATFSLPTLHFAARHSAHSPTWLYRFDAAHPLFGAMHGIDLLYLWNFRGLLAFLARGGALKGRRAALAGRYRAAWCEFIRSGTPGEDWPPYDTHTRMTRLFDLTDRVLSDPDRAHREPWAGCDVCTGISRAHAPAPRGK